MYILLVIATAIITLATLIQGIKAAIDTWDYLIQKHQYQSGKRFPKNMLLITATLIIVSLVFAYTTVTSSANTFTLPSTSVRTPTITSFTATPSISIATFTPTQTDTPVPTASPTPNDPNLLYAANFGDTSSWTNVGFQFNSSDNSISCDNDKNYSGSPKSYVPSTPDYKVVVTAQFISGDNNLQISGRINPNDGQHISLGYSEPYIRGNNQFSLDNVDIDSNAPFTLSATFKGPNVTILLHQGGINATVKYSTSESLNIGGASIIAINTALKIYSFKIFKA